MTITLQHTSASDKKKKAKLLLTQTDSQLQWYKVTVGFAELSTAGTTLDIDIGGLPAGVIIHSVLQKHSVAFSGGAISALTISVGPVGDLAKYGTAHNAFAAVGDTAFTLDTTTGLETFGGSTSIRAAAIATSANLDKLTIGSTDIYILVSSPNV